MATARLEYYTNMIEENKGDQRKLFKTCKRLFGQHCDDGLPPNIDCKTFASNMGKYFEQKILNIRRQFDNDLSRVSDDLHANCLSWEPSNCSTVF